MNKEKNAQLKSRVQEASTLFKSGHLVESQNLCYQILEHFPFQGQTLQLLGLIQINLGQFDEAIKHLEHSLTELKNNAVAHHNLASAYQLVGMREKAEEQNWLAVKLNPDYSDAYIALMASIDIDNHLNIIKSIQRLLKENDLTQREAAQLHVAAGIYFHHVKEYQRAFYYFEQGNLIQGVQYDVAKQHQQTLSSIKVFTRDFFKAHDTVGNREIEPVFYIGMPSCGTNPLDVILSKHPNTMPFHQNTDFLVLALQLDKLQLGNKNYPACVTHLTPRHIKACADIYLQHAKNKKPNQLISNSFPLNFNYVGLIKLLFPKAKFIHCQRHPLDTCLASFFNWLQLHYQYSHKLEHILQYYLDYLKVMQHWRGIFLQDILTVEFEALHHHTARELDKIMNFIGLKGKIDPNLSLNADARVHFEIKFSAHYTHQLSTLTNRLKPYINSYPPFC